MSSRYPSTLCWRVGSGLGCACGGHPGRRLGAAPRAGPLRQRHLDLPWKSVRISKSGVEVGTSGRVRVGWGYAAGRAGTPDD